MSDTINVSEAVLSAEQRALISESIREFSLRQGVKQSEEIELFASAYDGNTLIGGCVARIYDDWLYISDLWVAETHRKNGLGSQLLMNIETQAKGRDIVNAMLWTASFEAPQFYQKHGYEVCCILEKKPIGHSRIAMRKRL